MKKKFYGALLLGSVLLTGVWYLVLITMMTLTA